MMKVATRRGVSMIVGVSQAICAKLSQLGNKNIVHLPQQIAWEKFGLPRSKAALGELGYPTDRFTVGTIARLSPEKNIPMILACAKAMPDALFVVVGDGPQAAVLKGMAASLNNVAFIGRRTDVERFYAAFDVFLLTSNMEGLPLTILEAMASGTPVVASKVGAIPELVSDGVNGFVVHGGTQSYVAALNQLRDPVRQAAMSDNAFGASGIMMARGGERSINTLYDHLFQ
jgi:glycosyltransferase involved in cell wall biosynthesis